jgi:transcription initiation factor IIE alpha subunit
MREEDKEKAYGLILDSKGISKMELKKELGWTHRETRQFLDELYWHGLIDIKKGVITPVEEDKVWGTYIKRNVDTQYLRQAVDIEKIDSILRKEPSHLPKAEEPAISKSNRIEESWRILRG